jgi:PAS domain S-box-containing protein
MAPKLTSEELEHKVSVLEQEIQELRSKKEALRGFEEKYRLIVDNAITPIIYFDLDGRVQLVNSVSAKNLGGKADDFVGKSILEILPDFADEALERFQKIKETGERFEIQDDIALPWGKRWFLTSVQPVRNASDEIIAVQMIGVDITDRTRIEHALRESEEKARALLNATTDMAVLMDVDGIMLAINKAGAEKLGKTVDDLVGTCGYDYFTPELAKSRKAAIDKVIQTGEPLRNEDEDQGVILDQNIYPKFDEKGNVDGVAVFLLDITERRRAEEELSERKKELEIKTLDLEEVNTALKVLLKKRDEDKTVLEEKVLFSVKDLIFPYLEKLKTSNVDHRQKTYLNIIESNLNDIVSPFMSLSSYKLHKLTPTEIHVANLVKQGRSTKEIAEILNLAISTVNSHRDSIRRKLGINNRKINLRTHLISDSTSEISYIE